MLKQSVLALASVAAMTTTTPAAADGCTALLCLAGDWKSIAQCVDPVRAALRRVARGGGWPSCSSSDSGNNTNFQNGLNEQSCPIQYRNYAEGESGPYFSYCTYSSLVSVRVNNEPWANVYLNPWGGTTSTYYFTPARTALGALLDSTFDRDYSAWFSLQPPPAPPTPEGS
jgi:hypothetical protein